MCDNDYHFVMDTTAKHAKPDPVATHTVLFDPNTLDEEAYYPSEKPFDCITSLQGYTEKLSTIDKK